MNYKFQALLCGTFLSVISPLMAQSTPPPLPNETFVPSHYKPVNMMDVMGVIKKKDEFTFISKNAVIFAGPQCPLDFIDKFSPGKNFVQTKDFFAEYSKDIIFLKGRYNKNGEVEVSIDKLRDEDRYKLTIVLDEKGYPASKVKIL